MSKQTKAAAAHKRAQDADYLNGLRVELDDAERAGRPEHAANVRAEIAKTEARLTPATDPAVPGLVKRDGPGPLSEQLGSISQTGTTGPGTAPETGATDTVTPPGGQVPATPGAVDVDKPAPQRAPRR